jgi:SAM-dependent methyltransferase
VISLRKDWYGVYSFCIAQDLLMNIRLLATKAKARFHKVGLRRSIVEVPQRLFRRVPTTDFDIRNGTQTEARVPLWKLRVPFASARFGAEYRSPSEERIQDALSGIPHDVTFVDLGSGKGRALIVAARLGFKRVIGVEFAPALADISTSNLRITGARAEVIVGDAGEWLPPTGPLCLYLYSPFSIEVMRKVTDKIKNRRDETWVAYLNPTSATGCANLFDGILKRVAERPGLVVWH